MSCPSLSISIVTYKPDHQQFAEALVSLDKAAIALESRRPGMNIKLTVVDNGDEATAMQDLLVLVPTAACELVSSKQNVGYGRGHNLAITTTDSNYHLIMNPDVILDELALVAGIECLESDQRIVAVSPEATNGAGEKLYLCKKFPSVIDLGLRGFAPGFLKAMFNTRLAAYENRAVVDKGLMTSVDLISGCFMLCRTAVLKKAGGFNSAFFLYFEDFALSLELKKHGTLIYLPTCKIVHFGGDAGKKGFKHVMYFVDSAIKFFRMYGWKFV
ncbi:MAG: glycosyltransferase family 2 protein [Pseudomonadota bacterium]